MVLFYVALFAFFNTTSVPVDIVVAKRDVPLYVVASACFLCGAGVVGLAMALGAMRQARRRRGMKKRIASLTEEVKRLRNAPITEEITSAEEVGVGEI